MNFYLVCQNDLFSIMVIHYKIRINGKFNYIVWISTYKVMIIITENRMGTKAGLESEVSLSPSLAFAPG